MKKGSKGRDKETKEVKRKKKGKKKKEEKKGQEQKNPEKKRPSPLKALANAHTKRQTHQYKTSTPRALRRGGLGSKEVVFWMHKFGRPDYRGRGGTGEEH